LLLAHASHAVIHVVAIAPSIRSSIVAVATATPQKNIIVAAPIAGIADLHGRFGPPRATKARRQIPEHAGRLRDGQDDAGAFLLGMLTAQFRAALSLGSVVALPLGRLLRLLLLLLLLQLLLLLGSEGRRHFGFHVA